MTGSASTRVLERYFEALRAHDWEDLAGTLAEGVERTGPYLDVVRGRGAYVEFLAGVLPGLRGYELRVSRIHELADGGAVAELSETVELKGAARVFPELILFELDADARIARVDVYIKQPPAG